MAVGEALTNLAAAPVAEPARPVPLPAIPRGGRVGSTVAFSAVGFHYPSRPLQPALHNFSLILGVRNGNVPADGHVRLMAEHGRDEWICERAMIDLVTTGTRTYKIACGYY